MSMAQELAGILEMLRREGRGVPADNLENDEEIDERLARELVASDPQTPEEYETFCHTHQQQGRRDTEASKAQLGRVTSYDRLNKTLKWKSRSATAVELDDFLGQPLRIQQLQLASVELSSFQMWSFYQNEHRDAPFANMDTSASELRRRLGMGGVGPDEELVYWAHRLKSRQTAHRPTALDAELNEHWRPGGRTQPLDGAADGLPEVVHDPVTGEQLTRGIQRAF